MYNKITELLAKELPNTLESTQYVSWTSTTEPETLYQRTLIESEYGIIEIGKSEQGSVYLGFGGDSWIYYDDGTYTKYRWIDEVPYAEPLEVLLNWIDATLSQVLSPPLPTASPIYDYGSIILSVQTITDSRNTYSEVQHNSEDGSTLRIFDEEGMTRIELTTTDHKELHIYQVDNDFSVKFTMIGTSAVLDALNQIKQTLGINDVQ